MHRTLKSSLIALTLIASLPIAAHAQGFKSTISSNFHGPLKVEVILSEDLAHRANHLPKDLSQRGSTSRLNSAFAQNGHYGEKDINRLVERLESRILSQMEKRGVATSPNAATVLRITLTDAKPNRPTFRQLSQEVGLSFSSISIGGAKMEAEVLSADGTSLGTMEYSWYENDIRDVHGSGTWSDAKRSIDRFAKKASKNLAQSSPS